MSRVVHCQRTTALLIAIAAWTLSISACSRKMGAPSLEPAPPQVPSSTLRINVSVRGLPSQGGVRLGFCFAQWQEDDPQVTDVVIGRSGAGETHCRIEAIGPAWTWKEWTIGTVPSGFRVTACRPMIPGEYEAFVRAVVGSGRVRFRLNEDRSVEQLPLEDAQPGEMQTCPANERTEPRVRSGVTATAPDGGGALPIGTMLRDLEQSGHLKGAGDQ
jgi:hypothetical protein